MQLPSMSPGSVNILEVMCNHLSSIDLRASICSVRQTASALHCPPHPTNMGKYQTVQHVGIARVGESKDDSAQ